MSDEKKESPKDAAPKVLSKEILEKQVAESQKFIDYASKQIEALTKQLHQEAGVLGYATHLLRQFELPTEPKKDEKPPLEVK